jgi:hypothetical protein
MPNAVPQQALTEDEKTLLADLRTVVVASDTNLVHVHDEAARRLFPRHAPALESLANRLRVFAAAEEDDGVTRMRRRLETIDPEDLQNRMELFLKLLMQCGHEILELWVTNGAHYLDKEQFDKEAVLLVMVVLRVAGWHLPSPYAQNEASFDILFDVAATLDSEHTWWASVPLQALTERMRTHRNPNGGPSSRGQLSEDLSCLALAYRVLYYLLPIYITLVCCKDRGHAAAGRLMARDYNKTHEALEFTTSVFQFASEIAFTNMDFFVDQDASIFDLPEDAPWGIWVSLALGGRISCYQCRAPTILTHLAPWDDKFEHSYLALVASRLRFLAASDQFHFISELWTGDVGQHKLLKILISLDKQGPNLLRSGIASLGRIQGIDLSFRGLEQAGTWYQIPGSDHVRVPVAPLRVSDAPHIVPRGKQGVHAQM